MCTTAGRVGQIFQIPGSGWAVQSAGVHDDVDIGDGYNRAFLSTHHGWTVQDCQPVPATTDETGTLDLNRSEP